MGKIGVMMGAAMALSIGLAAIALARGRKHTIILDKVAIGIILFNK